MQQQSLSWPELERHNHFSRLFPPVAREYPQRHHGRALAAFETTAKIRQRPARIRRETRRLLRALPRVTLPARRPLKPPLSACPEFNGPLRNIPQGPTILLADRKLSIPGSQIPVGMTFINPGANGGRGKAPSSQRQG